MISTTLCDFRLGRTRFHACNPIREHFLVCVSLIFGINRCCFAERHFLRISGTNRRSMEIGGQAYVFNPHNGCLPTLIYHSWPQKNRAIWSILFPWLQGEYLKLISWRSEITTGIGIPLGEKSEHFEALVCIRSMDSEGIRQKWGKSYFLAKKYRISSLSWLNGNFGPVNFQHHFFHFLHEKN